MNREDITRMAREAGFKVDTDARFYIDDKDGICDSELERFAALVAAKASAVEQKKWQDQAMVDIHEAVLEEREACAKWLEDVVDAPNWAKQIRARGNT